MWSKWKVRKPIRIVPTSSRPPGEKGEDVDNELSQPAKELAEQGWIRQFMVDPEDAQEYIEIYEGLGREVRLEQAGPELMMKEECKTCVSFACESYLIIYTRD